VLLAGASFVSIRCLDAAVCRRAVGVLDPQRQQQAHHLPERCHPAARQDAQVPGTAPIASDGLVWLPRCCATPASCLYYSRIGTCASLRHRGQRMLLSLVAVIDSCIALGNSLTLV
jgi:hypothetical protein